MRIERIQIRNFKSIQEIDISPSQEINVFIGENSVGKSNVFDAVTWLLGPVYPSFNSTQPQDRYNGDENNEIKIRLTFDDGNYLELAESWEYNGYQTSGLNFNGGFINDIERQKYCSAYVGVDRA